MVAENQNQSGNSNPKKVDSTQSKRVDQPVLQSSPPPTTSANTANPRSTPSNNSSSVVNNQGRSRSSLQTDKPYNASSGGNPRRSANYGGSSNRHHGRSNASRHSMDPNITSHQNTISQATSNPASNPHNVNSSRSGGFYSRGRYDQSHHHYSGNHRNYDNRNQPSTVVDNEPQINRFVMDFSEFPSLNDDDHITTNPPNKSTTTDSTYTHPTSVATAASNTNNQRRNSATPNISSNQPLFGDPSSSSQLQNSNFTGHSPNTTRHYHNTRRGGGNYNRGSNRDHQGGNSYGARGGNHHRTSNTSHQSHMSATSPSSGAGGAAASSNTHNITPQHHPTVVPAPPNTRPRGNRRNMGNAYDRRTSNRDYNQLPNMMNGVRLGTPAGPQMPVNYFNGNRAYAPIVTSVPLHSVTQVTPDNINNSVASSNTISSTNKPAYVSPESKADQEESELYKSLTSDPNISKEDQVMYQIEFYFSNCNLRHDTYLRSQMDDEGYVYAPIVLGFHRISKYGVTIPQLIKMMEKTTKLEHKVVDNATYIRRIEDPTKWTNKGLEQQGVLPSETEPSASQSIPVVINPNTGLPPRIHPMPSFNPYPHYHPNMHHSSGPYMPQFGHPHVPLNFGMYGFEDVGTNMYYDAPISSFEFAGVPYVESTPNPNNSVVSSYSQQSDISLMNAPQNSFTNHSVGEPSNYMQTATYANTNSSGSGATREHSATEFSNTSSYQQQPENPAQSNRDHGNSSSSRVPTTSSRVPQNDSSPKNIETLTSSDVNEAHEADSNFQLSNEEYNNLLSQVQNQRQSQSSLSRTKTSTREQQKLYLYWTQNLVLNFELEKYNLFKKFALEDANLHQTEGITLLYQFYERFLHRFPLTSTTTTGSSGGALDSISKSVPENDAHSTKRLSLQIFEDFQQVSYDDHVHNENVSGLKKLVRFRTQFSNPSRQPPSFQPFVQETIDTLGLENSQNNPAVNGDRPSASTAYDDPSAKSFPFVDASTSPSSASSSNSEIQSNFSTHH